MPLVVVYKRSLGTNSLEPVAGQAAILKDVRCPCLVDMRRLGSFRRRRLALCIRPKRRVGRRLGSAAVVQEGAQNLVCAYLSVALLVGLLANAVAGLWWADPAAALVIGGVAAREGVESWRGEGCCDAC